VGEFFKLIKYETVTKPVVTQNISYKYKETLINNRFLIILDSITT